MKHIEVAHLWLQDEVRSNRLRGRRVKSEDNVADTGSKVLSRTVIAKHSTNLGYICMGSDFRDGSQQQATQIAAYAVQSGSRWHTQQRQQQPAVAGSTMQKDTEMVQ